MPERFELSYELTREDWLAFNDACIRESPDGQEAVRKHQRTMRRQALWLAPFCTVGSALSIGRDQSTQGM